MEYARAANPSLDGDRLVDTVLSLTAELLQQRFELQLDNRRVSIQEISGFLRWFPRNITDHGLKMVSQNYRRNHQKFHV